MIDRGELAQWLREHDYALVTREQAARLDGAWGLPGVVPWDEHRRALAKADAELAAARDAIAAVRELCENYRDEGQVDVGTILAAVSGPVPHPVPIDHGDGPRTETVP